MKIFPSSDRRINALRRCLYEEQLWQTLKRFLEGRSFSKLHAELQGLWSKASVQGRQVALWAGTTPKQRMKAAVMFLMTFVFCCPICACCGSREKEGKKGRAGLVERVLLQPDSWLLMKGIRSKSEQQNSALSSHFHNPGFLGSLFLFALSPNCFHPALVKRSPTCTASAVPETLQWEGRRNTVGSWGFLFC